MEADQPKSKPRVLVVDDEQGVRDMFMALLTVAGYAVRTEASGASALAYLESGSDNAMSPVDLVILDVLMPAMNGYEVCRQIKSHPRLKYVPVLLVTALASLQDRIDGVDVGADDYVPKPFRTEELLVRVRALLRINQVQRELLDRNAELAALRNFNESILQNMGNGLLTVGLDGQIMALNQAASSILGCEPQEWIGQQVNDLKSPMQPLARLVRQTLGDGNPRAHEELGITCGDGRTVPLRVNSTLLRDDAGAVSGVICVLEDLTEIKAMEEERRRLDRLAVLGQMAATVAHEIRNPLLTLSLGIQFLEKSLGAESSAADTIQRLRRQVDRLTGIMNEFLAFSRAPKLELVRCDVGEVLDRVLDAAEPGYAEHQMTISREYAGGLQLDLDAEHMERVFTNLVFNALDAMQPGGKLYVSTEVEPIEEWLDGHPSAEPTPSTPTVALLRFADTGSGISPEVLSRIFEPFFTTKPKGTGLGLAIVERTIREHGGHIVAESAPGQGTVFTLCLPMRR